MPQRAVTKKTERSAKPSRIRRKAKSLPERERASRLDPAVRRDLILESAAKLLVERGVSSCTLEAVGVAAGVSKALVYRYFESREALFGALLTREFDYIRGRNFHHLPPEADFEAALRIHVPRYMSYVSERGALMRALVHDVTVIDQLKKKSKVERTEILDFWVEQTVQKFGVPEDLARLGCIMVIAAEEAAEVSLRRGKVPLDRAADFWVRFILGGWASVAKHYSR